jgi:hypothetical protein
MNPTFQRARRFIHELATRRAMTAMLALAICAGPLWLWSVPLRWYRLKLDDFVYLARSRSLSSLSRHLATPHNAHVVPLFLCETHLVARLAGTMEALPRVLAGAAYATLVLAMLATGHLVARETGRPARGLAAMAALGVSSVLGPAVLWYSASQALAAGTVILAMLVALQGWRARGSWWLLAVGLLAAVAAPLFWSGGYTAGLAGMAYLWADGRRSCRIAAAAPLAASLATAGLVWVFAGQAIVANSHLDEGLLQNVMNLPVAAAHSAQAICEALILNNLGLDAPTAAAQAIVLCLGLAGSLTLSRRSATLSRRRHGISANPLEAAGAVLVVANLAMVFAVRGTETSFENLRALGWYDAIPQLGAVVFVAGWWSGPLDSSLPKSIEPPRPRDLGSVVLFLIVLLLLQTPRAHRVIFAYDGLAAEIVTDENPDRPRFRSRADLAGQAEAQRRALAQLDSIEQTAREQGIGRSALRLALGRTIVPGMPESVVGLSALDLLDIPDTVDSSP